MALVLPWLIVSFSTLVHQRYHRLLAYLSLCLLVFIVVSVPLGGDFNSIIERGEFELSRYDISENEDYILLLVAYFSSLIGLETPQGYSVLIILILLRLSRLFGITFLILNLIFFSYLGITGYHRNYLSLLFLVWGFFGRNPFLIIVAIFTHKAVILYLSVLIFSMFFRDHLCTQYKVKNNLFKFLFILILILSVSYILTINYKFLGPVSHYFEHYVYYESDRAQGAVFRNLSFLVCLIFFYYFNKKQEKINLSNRSLLNQRKTIELAIFLSTLIGLVFMIQDHTVATERVTLFSFLLLSLLSSELYNKKQNNLKLFLIVSPFIILNIVWLFISDKAYFLWGGALFY